MKANWFILLGAVLIGAGGLTVGQYDIGLRPSVLNLLFPPLSHVTFAASLLLCMLLPRGFGRGVVCIILVFAGVLWSILADVFLGFALSALCLEHNAPCNYTRPAVLVDVGREMLCVSLAGYAIVFAAAFREVATRWTPAAGPGADDRNR